MFYPYQQTQSWIKLLTIVPIQSIIFDCGDLKMFWIPQRKEFVVVMPKKILVADDSVVIQKSIGITFAQEDFELQFASNGEEAAHLVNQFNPHLILADVTMPKVGGLELTEKLTSNKNTQHIPILLLVGARDDVDEAKATQAGAKGMIPKPFDSSELLQAVQNTLSQAAQTPQPEAQPAAQPQEGGPRVASSDPSQSVPEFGSMDDIELDMGVDQASDEGQDLEDSVTQGFQAFDMGADTPAPQAESSPEPPQLDTVNPVAPEPQQDHGATEVAFKESEMDPIDFSMDMTPDLDEPQESAQTISAPKSKEDSQDLAIESTPSTPQESAAPSQGVSLESLPLTEEQIQNIVTRAFQNVIERIAWEVVPDLAERIIREEIQRLTGDKGSSD